MISNLLRSGYGFKWSLVDQFFVSGGNFLIIAICANFLDVDSQGKLGYILAWYFGSIIINNGIIFHYASVKAPHEKNKDEYLFKLAWMQTALSLCFSLAAITLVLLLSHFESFYFTSIEFICILLYLFVQQIADFSRRSAYIFRDALVAVKLSALMYTTRAIILLIVKPDELSIVLIIFIITSTVSLSVVMSMLLKSRVMLSSIWGFVKVHISESIWVIRSAPAIWLWSVIPIFMLGAIETAAAMAVFFTIRSLSNMSNVIMELLETEFAARLGRYQYASKEKASEIVKRVKITGLFLWVIGLVVVILYGDLLIRFLFGSEYEYYSDFLTMFWVSNAITFLHRLNAVYLRTSGRSEVITKSYATAAALMLIIGVPLISTFGLTGGVVLAILAELLILIMQYTYSRGWD